MAFVSMIFATIGIVAFALLCCALATCVALAIVFGVLNKKIANGKKIFKVLTIVFSVACGVVFLCMTPFLCLGGYLLWQQTVVPDNYVDCPIAATIDESGFSTDDGQRFVELPFGGYDVNLEEMRVNAAFSVKPKGLFERANWSNVYLIDTTAPFALYNWVDQNGEYSHLYVQQEDFDAATEYYNDNCHWQQYFAETPCSTAVSQIVEYYLNSNQTPTEIEQWGYGNSQSIIKLSNDGFVVTKECWLRVYEGKGYVAVAQGYDQYYRYFGYQLTEEETALVTTEIFGNTDVV